MVEWINVLMMIGAKNPKIVLSILAAFGILSGCTVKYPVVGRFDRSDELFRGMVVSRTMTGWGSLDLEGVQSGTKCVGRSSIRFAPPGERGKMVLDCEDGRRVEVNYRVTQWGRGYGSGKDQTGNRFRFTFGMSDREALIQLEKLP